MNTQPVQIRLTPQMLEKIDKLIEKGYFTSRSEFSRICVMKELKKWKEEIEEE